MTQSHEATIKEGPSKFDLMAALFDGKRVEFTISSESYKKKVAVQINSVAASDGGRQDWLVKGIIIEVIGDLYDHLKSSSFQGHYESRKRTGYITVGDRGCSPWKRK